MLYEHQRALDDPHLVGYAAKLGLDAKTFIRSCTPMRTRLACVKTS